MAAQLWVGLTDPDLENELLIALPREGEADWARAARSLRFYKRVFQYAGESADYEIRPEVGSALSAFNGRHGYGTASIVDPADLADGEL